MVDLYFDSPSLDELSKLEWLVTNGIGGYASGTLSGLLTRRYHGLLVASMKPPVDRINMVVKIDEWAKVGDKTFALFANQWFSAEEEIVPPTGCATLVRFSLDGQIPTWQYRLEGNLLEKKIWMEQGENITYLMYTHLAGSENIKMTLKGMLAYTNFHYTNKKCDDYQVEPIGGGVRVTPGAGGNHDYYILSRELKYKTQSIWMEKFFLAAEDYRGLDALTDLYNGVDLFGELEPGESITVVLGTNPGAGLDGDEAVSRRREYEQQLVSAYPGNFYRGWVRQLVTAADQFIVQREVKGKSGHSVIAGYHWFSDWGRDTMIALPGLTLATGRYEVAESILRTFAEFLDRGMLPNRFPDLGEEPVYNTIDATLWYFEAVYQYFKNMLKIDPEKAMGLVKDLYPKLNEIIRFHQEGTRYRIHVDGGDGLIYGGAEGVQLTWMDAKVDDFVVTPRIGKPVEINALWHSALCIMAEFSELLGKNSSSFSGEAARVKLSFERYWNSERGYCYDVLDGPDGDDTSLRPNQVLAAAVSFSPLEQTQIKTILRVCEERLLTKFGLRSLASDERGYVPIYGGDIWQRDTGYHQGTVWGWLIGPYLVADYRVNKDIGKVFQILQKYCEELNLHGLGSISEIFDGAPPHISRGCIAQAWSVGAALWVLDQLEEVTD